MPVISTAAGVPAPAENANAAERYVTVGAAPVPELTVSSAWDQPGAGTAGKVADAGPTPSSVSSASMRNEPAAEGRKNSRGSPSRRSSSALDSSTDDSRIVGAVRSAATRTGALVDPVVVHVPTTAVTV